MGASVSQQLDKWENANFQMANKSLRKSFCLSQSVIYLLRFSSLISSSEEYR